MLKLTQRVREIAFEAGLILGDLAVMLAQTTACRLTGHGPLRWHQFASGDAAGICTRCSCTVVPLAKVWP